MEMGVYVLLGSFLAMIVFGVPIAYSLGVSSIITMIYLDLPIIVVFQKISDGMDSFSLIAIPFFVLAGQIMADGGMARRLVNFSNLLVGWVQGGLAMVNVLASMFFGGISGSSVADTSSIGSIMIPMMKDKGYDDDFSVNVTITSSTQGIIIPPSHNAIIYSLAAGGTVSIAKLFLAGIIPGIMVGLALMFVSFVIAKKRSYPKEELVTLKEGFKICRDAIWGLVTAFIIVGGVLSGVFTPTESSAIAVVYALFVTFFIYKDIPLSRIGTILANAFKTIAIVIILIGTSSAFGWLIAYMRVPVLVSDAMLSLSENPIIILMVINVMLLAFGTIMDMAPLILIVTPILLPVAKFIGMDPVHFGIVMMLNLGIGLCTPPVGSTLFVGCAIGEVSMEKVVKSIWPFYFSMVLVLLIVTYFPIFSMWIPNSYG
jgi:tripartite ATP-independent transporter DctM subunit